MPRDESYEASSGVKSVKLAFRVLEGVSAAGASVGVSELADALKTTKGTVFRHLQTLMTWLRVAGRPGPRATASACRGNSF